MNMVENDHPVCFHTISHLGLWPNEVINDIFSFSSPIFVQILVTNRIGNWFRRWHWQKLRKKTLPTTHMWVNHRLPHYRIHRRWPNKKWFCRRASKFNESLKTIRLPWLRLDRLKMGTPEMKRSPANETQPKCWGVLLRISQMQLTSYSNSCHRRYPHSINSFRRQTIVPFYTTESIELNKHRWHCHSNVST